MCASSRNGPTPLLSRSVPEAQIRDLARNSCTTYNFFMDGNKRDAKGKQQPLAPTQPGPDRQPLPPQRSLVPGRPFPPYRPCSIRPFSSLRRAHCRRAGVGAGKDPGTKWPSSRPSLPKLRRRLRRRDQDRKGEGFGCSGGPPGGSTGGDGGSLRGPVSRRGDIRYGRGDRGGLRRQNPRSWDRGLEVHVENDMNALTLAEARCVSGRGSRTLSSRWRRIYRGRGRLYQGLPGAGEFGHILEARGVLREHAFAGSADGGRALQAQLGKRGSWWRQRRAFSRFAWDERDAQDTVG